MSGHHEPCGQHEVFLGNTPRKGGSMTHLADRFKTVRLGQKALSVDGKPLSLEYAPIFIHRSEEPAYDAYMMSRTRR